MNRKIIPGVRLFVCDQCGETWGEPSRDCQSPSISECLMCNADTSPDRFILKPNWETDAFGNLIEGKEYDMGI